MTYLIILEIVTILLALFIKLIAFHLLIKIFNRTIKFLTTLKAILFYELGVIFILWIGSKILSYLGFRLSLPTVILFPITFLISVIALYLFFNFVIRKFSILINWKKSLVVFLIMFFIIAPALSFFQVTLVYRSIKMFSSLPDVYRELSLTEGYAPFQPLPPSLMIFETFNKLSDSLFNGWLMKELKTFLMRI